MGSINSFSSSGWPAGLGQLQVRFLGSATVEKSGLFSLGKWSAAFAASRLIHNPVFLAGGGDTKGNVGTELQKPNHVSQQGNSQAEM